MRLFSPKVWVGAIAALALGLSAQPAQAGMVYKFDNITGNSATDAAAGEAQLRVWVQEAGTTEVDGVTHNRVSFTFYHVGTTPMSITDIYFDDGTLLSISSIDSGTQPGVSFEEGASPPNLPGGNTIGWNSEGSRHFSADSKPAVQPNGVAPGEWLTIFFALLDGQDYDDVIAAINLSLATPGVDVEGGLRIGLHVQGFSGGGSESFVNGDDPVDPNEPPGPVPAPGGLVLLASMLPFGLILRRRLARREVAA